MGEGRVNGRICQEKLIYITVNDTVIPFEKTGTECANGTRTSFVILRRAGNSDPVDLTKMIRRSVIGAMVNNVT
ncbi:hypothetical protein AA0229_1712 [Gluconobacter cerinus NRIC 0229]|nr:hypothetical protein AA0229_1712 [Gluconobacter cerinus NRIC 0229]